MKSSVKANLIAAAVASVLGTSAAYALPPSATINYTFYAGGGSAQANAVYWAVTQTMVASSIDSYSDNGSASSNNARIISGTTSAALTTSGTTIPAGSNILFFYKFTGGSFPNGIAPQVGSGSSLTYAPVSLITGAASTGQTASASKPSYSFTGTTTTESDAHIPDWGVSDVEVNLFNFTDNLNGTTSLTSAQVTAIAQDGIYDNLFGVAVSDTVFSSKTSFTKPEIVGILSGAITDWAELYGDNGSKLAEGPIVLLDRGSGSGTKASANQYFLNYPGGLATGGSVAPNSVNASSVANYTGTTLSLTAAGFQDVKEGSSGAIVTDLQAANTNSLRAIAILGLEFPQALQSPAGGYSFVAINGVGPDSLTGSTDNINSSGATTYSNVITGKYDYFFQNSLNTRSGFLTGGTVNATWTTALKANFQSAKISGANGNGGVPGLMLDPKTVGSQVKGVVNGTRLKHSTAPLQPYFNALSPSVIGSDPL